MAPRFEGYVDGRSGILFTWRPAPAMPTYRVIGSAPPQVKTTGRARVSAAAPTSKGQQRRLFLIDGPSLVYGAFYALPESIASSTGVPTNAIFGFASMLVKIITESAVCPTVVAWTAGTSVRAGLLADYTATRRSRPDLLKTPWSGRKPLVEAFGYRN